MNQTIASGGDRRTATALVVLLVALLAAACGESPAAPGDSPKAVPPSSEAAGVPPPTGRLADEPGILETLSDPFVADLVGHLVDRDLAARLESGIRAARMAARAGRHDEARRALDDLLPAADADVAVSGGPDDPVILAVLALILPESGSTDSAMEGALR